MELTGPTIGSLCTGYGGLDLAVEALTGGHTAWVSEIDPHASQLLEQRFPNATNIGDLTELADQPEPVDIVTAGFPCQPLSQAGHRKGVDDDRWIWDDILALVRRMEPRPRLLMLENVAGLLTANGGDAMARVIEGLASIGYLGSWGTARASDIGACHRRERVFIVAALADAPGIRVGPDARADRRDGDSGPRPAGPPVSAGSQVAHSADPETGDRNPARLIPTPAASNATRGPDLARADRPDSGGMDLVTTTERLMPTPLSSEWKGRSGRHRTDGTIDRVADAVHELLPTPTAADGDVSRTTHARGNPTLQGAAAGRRDADLKRHEEAGRMLPTPTTLDHIAKRTTHAGGNPTLQGATGGVNPVDLERHVEAGRLLPTPVKSDAAGSRRSTACTEDWVSNTGTTLLDAALEQLLPTPTKALSQGGNINRSGDRSDELLLGGILRRREVFGDYAEAITRHTAVTGIEPPDPTDGQRRLNPRFVEWMMMLPPGWVTDLELTRTAQLKLLGNGVVPPQAFAAYSNLLTRLS